MSARPDMAQKQDFIDRATEIAAREYDRVPVVHASYTPEERAILRYGRVRVSDRQPFQVSRDKEAYWFPAHRTDMTYERITLKWVQPIWAPS